MQKKILLTCLAAGALFTLLPVNAFAQTTTSNLVSEGLVEAGESVTNFVWGWAFAIVAILAGFISACVSFSTHSPKPFFTWAGITIAAAFVMPFITSIQSISGMLIP